MLDTDFPPSGSAAPSAYHRPGGRSLVADLNCSEFRALPPPWRKEMAPHLGDVQIASALILSRAGKKPLAQYRVP